MSAAARARQTAGLSLEAAAKRLRVSARYLRAVEIHGGAPFALASRASTLYKTRIEDFLNQGGETPSTSSAVRRRRGRPTE